MRSLFRLEIPVSGYNSTVARILDFHQRLFERKLSLRLYYHLYSPATLALFLAQSTSCLIALRASAERLTRKIASAMYLAPVL